MDLFKLEDLVRNSQVIISGYGQQYEGGGYITNHLKFIRLNMFINELVSLNTTISYTDPYTKTCPGMS